MAASLREGASGSFSSSFLGQDIVRLGREEARARAKSHQSHLRSEGMSFELPSPTNPSWGVVELKNLLASHSSVGVFAGQEKWFEARKLETWLESLTTASASPLSFAYPRMEGESFEYRNCRANELVANAAFGLEEAPSSAPLALPTLIFAPCTLADRCGARMGRGKGHFDRYLARRSGVFTVGVCHEEFLLDQFPSSWIQPHDRSVNALLTNSRFFNIRHKGDF